MAHLAFLVYQVSANLDQLVKYFATQEQNGVRLEHVINTTYLDV